MGTAYMACAAFIDSPEMIRAELPIGGKHTTTLCSWSGGGGGDDWRSQYLTLCCELILILILILVIVLTAEPLWHGTETKVEAM